MRRVAACIAVVVALCCGWGTGSVAAESELLLKARPSTLTPQSNSFAVVASFKSQRGAMRRLFELRERIPGIDAVVFPPAGSGRYWTVAVASFVAQPEAANATRFLRRSRLTHDAYVIGMRQMEWHGRPFVPRAASIDLSKFPVLTGRVPGVVTPDVAHVVILRRFTSASEAMQALASFEQFKGVRLVVLESDSTHAIAAANYVDAEGAKQAIALAQRLGVRDPEDIVVPAGAPLWKESQEIAEQRRKIAAKVTECYKGLSTTVRQLHDCSGLWLTPSLLTQCLVESDCYAATELPDVENFLKSHGLTSLDQQLGVQLSAIVPKADFRALGTALDACRKAAAGSQSAFDECAVRAGLNKENVETLTCAASAATSAAIAACLTKGLPQDQAAQVACLESARGNELELARCLGFDPTKLNALKQCTAATSRSQGTMFRDCVLPSLGESERRTAECLLANRNNAVGALKCSPNTADLASRYAAVSECAARFPDSTSRAAACIASKSGVVPATIASCLGGTEITPELAAQCAFPGNKDAVKAARLASCIADGADAVTLLGSCSEGVVDPKVSAFASCASKAGGSTERIAGCAAGQVLPPEAARLAQCAATSQSATGVAVCAVAPNLSEEWRIAAECAVSSGGVPVTFAACAAGRLTVRELTKCFTTGDCFGPNNEIVKVFNTIANDLQHGLGENNDIVKAAKGVTDAAREAKDAVVAGIKEIPLIGPVVKGAEDICKGIGICK